MNGFSTTSFPHGCGGGRGRVGGAERVKEIEGIGGVRGGINGYWLKGGEDLKQSIMVLKLRETGIGLTVKINNQKEV